MCNINLHNIIQLFKIKINSLVCNVFEVYIQGNKIKTIHEFKLGVYNLRVVYFVIES